MHGDNSPKSPLDSSIPYPADPARLRPRPLTGPTAAGPKPQLTSLLDQLRAAQNEASALSVELAVLDRRLSSIESSVFFRFLRATGDYANSFRRRLGRLLLHSTFHPLYLRLFGTLHRKDDYRSWLSLHKTSDPFLNLPPALASNSTTFSVIVPTRDPNPTWFRQAVASIQAQNYPHWQACVCLDADVSVEIRDWLASLAAADPRFAIIPGVGGGISSALNLAAAQATGDFLAFLDHDDLLEPTALAHFASTLAAHPAEIAYSDEDYIDPDGQPLRPNFKPGYSPELLHRCMYMGHLLAVSRSAFQSAGGFRSECDGAQDFDLVLRLVAGGAQAVHVPRVLYHWREHPSSTASGPAAKPAAHEAGRRVLSELIARQSPPASVTDGHRANAYRITRTLPPGTRASIIIPSRNPKLLQACLSSIRAHPSALPFELLVVNHRHDRVERRMASVIQSHGAISLPFDGDFNFSVLCNLAASRANGSVLVFLNDDVSLMQPDWLSSLVSTLHGDRVAIAGAQLLYPSGAIQHAGIALGLVDGAGHPGRHLFDSPNWPWINFTRDVSAVSGACLTIHRHIFEELGGFHTDFPLNYNDVDLCLRAREAGYRVVLDASVRLIHMEASTRTAGTRSSERLAFFRRWGRLVDSGDPFFSPNLSCESEGLTLRY